MFELSIVVPLATPRGRGLKHECVIPKILGADRAQLSRPLASHRVAGDTRRPPSARSLAGAAPPKVASHLPGLFPCPACPLSAVGWLPGGETQTLSVSL